MQILATDSKRCRQHSGLCPTLTLRAGMSTAIPSDGTLSQLGRVVLTLNSYNSLYCIP